MWKSLLAFTIIFHGLVYLWKKEWILRFDTRKFNNSINKLSQSWTKKYFRIWFRFGSYVTIFCGFPFTMWLFLRTIYYTLTPYFGEIITSVTSAPIISSSTEIELHQEQSNPFPDAEILSVSSSSSSNSYLAIQPLVPGYNIPLNQLPYYLLAILIAVVIHELGHAVASASHNVPILSVGLSLFGPLIPTAHVELNSNQLRDAQFKKQLDILTAGIWNNIYLSLICYFVIPSLLPGFLWPTHSTGNGITVTTVYSNSGAGGPAGLKRGDIIIGIENCPVEDYNVWLTCLENLWNAEPAGFCLNKKSVLKMSNNSEGCCGQDADISPTHLCFMEINSVSNEIPPIKNEPDENPKHAQVKHGQIETSINNHSNITTNCLPAIPTLMNHNDDEESIVGHIQKCYAPNYACPSSSSSSSKNNPSETESKDNNNNENNVEEISCYLPRIVKQLRRFRIVQIKRRQSELKEPVLFVGNLRDLLSGLRTSDYVPRDWWVSRLFGFSFFSLIPVEIETVLLLTAGLSAGLAIVNVLPIYGLDGYHVVDSIVREKLTNGKTWDPKKSAKLVNYISYIGVIIILLTILCSIIQSM